MAKLRTASLVASKGV